MEINTNGWYTGDNARLFKLMSIFLNLAPDYIEPGMIESITGGNACADKSMVEYAYASVAAAACGLDVYDNKEDRRFFRERFLPMFKLLDVDAYKDNAYYKTVKLPDGDVCGGRWSFGKKLCKPYEAFVYGDPEIKLLRDGSVAVTPKIGFFDVEYYYHAVCEGGREWMTLLPNETATTSYAVERSRGRVLTFGLGLGYFAFMASEKPSVASVTVVERDKDVIDLFTRCILPQFPNRDKITVTGSDAFDYAETQMAEGHFDTIFTDIWHDPSDGVELYLRMKEYEGKIPGPEYIYWLEDTLKLYI